MHNLEKWIKYADIDEFLKISSFRPNKLNLHITFVYEYLWFLQLTRLITVFHFLIKYWLLSR